MTQTSIYESGQYLENNPDWHEADSPFKARWIADLLARANLSPEHVVEIGCGSGQILVELARLWPDTRFEGYDISPQAMAIAQPKAREGLTFHHSDYFAQERKRPDVTMAIDVFEHVDDYMGFIRKMQAASEWKVFHVPLDLSVQALLRQNSLNRARDLLGHIHYFTKESALRTLQDCGCEVVEWMYTHGNETMPGKALRTRLANVPRKLLRLIGTDFSVRVMGGSSMMVLAR
jgi:SAM-dependent methyltransferase